MVFSFKHLNVPNEKQNVSASQTLNSFNQCKKVTGDEETIGESQGGIGKTRRDKA